MENQSTTASMQFLLLEQVQFLKVKDDSLLQWELVDVIDAEEEEESDDGNSTDSITHQGFGSWDSLISWSVSSPNDSPIEGIAHSLLPLDADVEDPHQQNHHDVVVVVDDDDDAYGGEQSDDDDDDNDGYDLDDELVPWDVGNKFVRQRMRKLGKRAFSKMNNSKRSPHLFVRPGCVRGKHGLGLKHNC